MTGILTEMLRNSFELENLDHIMGYESEGKIYINLTNEKRIVTAGRNLKNKPQFTSHKRIDIIAGNIFDVDFLYETRGLEGPAVFFMPSKLDRYNENHKGHIIRVQLPEFFPIITILTGHKGHYSLMDKQRENYYRFIKNVYYEFHSMYLTKEIFRK